MVEKHKTKAKSVEKSGKNDVYKKQRKKIRLINLISVQKKV